MRIHNLQTTPLSATSKALQACMRPLLRWRKAIRTHNSSFCVLESCLRSIPRISVPIAGVKCLTLVAAPRRLALAGSANKPRSTTSCSWSGSQERSGKDGYKRFFHQFSTRLERRNQQPCNGHTCTSHRHHHHWGENRMDWTPSRQSWWAWKALAVLKLRRVPWWWGGIKQGSLRLLEFKKPFQCAHDY